MAGQFLYGYATGKTATDAYVQNHVPYELYVLHLLFSWHVIIAYIRC